MNGKNLTAAFEDLCQSFDTTQNRLRDRSIPTGVDFLMHFIGSFQAGDFVLIAACPSVGATSIALQMGAGICTDEFASLPVLYFTFGYPASKIAFRLFVQTVQKSDFDLILDLVEPKTWPELRSKLPDQLAKNFFIFDDTSISAQDVKALCRGFNIGMQPGAVFIDHVDLIRPAAHCEEPGYVSKTLKKIARELNTVVVALVELPLPVTRKEYEYACIADRNSQVVIEHDADHVIYLYRKDYFSCLEERGASEIRVSKTRGTSGSCRLFFDRELMLFKSPDTRPEGI
jgi:replicative DNA helicase